MDRPKGAGASNGAKVAPAPAEAENETRKTSALLGAELPETHRDLLRGISTKHVMSGTGNIFRTGKSANQTSRRLQRKSDYFANSVPVQQLDSFLSHAWCDTWWHKGIALCFIFNLKAANLAGLATVTVLTISGHLCYKYSVAGQETVVFVVTWGAFTVFAVVFFFGQRVLPFLRRLVFLDKACIVQDDIDKRKAGVAALHVFLRESKRMDLLWSPGYFKRLWCTWEVAAYSKLVGTDRIFIFPLELGPFVIAVSCLATVLLIAYDVLRISGGFDALLGAFPGEGQFDRLCTYIVTINMALLCVPYNWLFSFQVEQAHQISTQLTQFSLADAACDVASDRKKIVRDIAALFGSELAFERYLVNDFLPKARARMGGSLFPFAYKRALQVQFLYAGCGRLAVADTAPGAVFAITSYTVLYLGVNPLIFTQVDIAYRLLDRMFPFLLHKHRLKVACALAPFEALIDIPVYYFGSRWLVYQLVRALWPGFQRPAVLFPLVSSE